jgi:GrpB-like predicted nucleotidyltransferase (UPF0157 family)
MRYRSAFAAMTDVELIGGHEKREIRIVSPDPEWPGMFARERARIAAALGPAAIRIDHIGSTAVAGLPAKPIIDIDVSVAEPDVEDTYLPRLIAAGYHLRVREPGHRMLRTTDLSVHVHICQAGSDWERRHLLFRDWLRRDARDRAAYAKMKVSLAAQEWTDMNVYAAAKGPIIAEITGRAERWATCTQWRPS